MNWLGIAWAVPEPERWEADRLLLDYAVLEAGCRGADQVAEASAALLESLRTGAGTLAYRRRQPGVRYVDAIGLACPLGGRLRGTYGKRGILEPGGEAGGGI